jgi:glutathione S-transferase
VKLYICWGACPVPGGRPCRLAYEALAEAGHDPDVIKAYGTRLLPDSLGPPEAGLDTRRLIDERRVPVLVTDDGEVVSETRNIVAWARDHPASAGTAPSA